MPSLLRPLLRAPVLSLVIVLSLAAGIGANTTIFSFLGSTVFQPLPGVRREVLAVRVDSARGSMSASSWLEYNDLRDRLAPQADLLAMRSRPLYLDDGDRTERVWSQLVSENFFRVLDVAPARGRFFTRAEATAPGSAAVAVISHRFWQRHFGANPAALGQTVRFNSQPFTIIGIAPPGFHGGVVGAAFDVWVPLTMSAVLAPDTREFTNRRFRTYELLASLAPGATRAGVQRELDLTARALLADFPEANRDITFSLLSLWRGTRGGQILIPVYATLQLFAVLVLVVVCVNTANLLLARATVRRREIGIRLAIGAGSARILRQLLAESLVLALAGTLLGVVIALWGVDSVRHLPLPSGMPVRLEAALDTRALLFAAGLGTFCGVLFGLAPALQLARLDVLPALRGGSGAIAGRSRLRDLLVATEVGTALVLLVLAGVFYQSFRHAQHLNPGYDVDRVALASLDLIGRGYSAERRATFLRDLQARLLALPAVEAAAIGFLPPIDLHGLRKETLWIDGVKPEREAATRALFAPATAGYFATLGVPFLAGRDLAPQDQTNLPLDIVINETAARRFFGDRPPLGRKIALLDQSFEVVGVVRDANYEALGEPPQPAVWPTLRSLAISFPTIYVRTRSGDPSAVLPMLRAVVRDLDPELVVSDARTFAQHIDSNLVAQRVSATLLAYLGPLALVLAAIGLYAVLAHAVSRRTQEIGVRLTLGATPQGVVWHMVRQGMRVVALGAGVGWLVALGLGWFFQKKLTGVPLGDPLIYGGIPLLLLAVATVACWLPARRAAKVDPVVALRAD